MTLLIQAIFFALAALVLTAAIMVVTVRNIVHAALWLIASFFGAGALYLLMEAEFVAVVQVLIYVGAISILIIMAIMLTPDIANESVRQLFRHWWVALVVAGGLFGLLIVPTVVRHTWSVVAPATSEPVPLATAREIGTAFMREYLLPFEIASVLLLVALIGAIVIVFEDGTVRRRVLTLAEEVALRRRRTTDDGRRTTDERDEDTNLQQPPAERDEQALVGE